MNRIRAPWLAAPETRAVMAALAARGLGESRFVGGCVRNAVLGEAVDDIDIATQLAPEAVIEAAKAAGLRVAPTGLDHGTVTVIAGGRPFEVTTLRRDVSTDGRRATVAFTRDWAEDAARRDFRLNALYADADGTLHDPTGAGIADALARRVVFVGDPARRIEEDYLRILRFFRFSAWYAESIDEEGLSACQAGLGGLAALSAERVWKELKKLMAAYDPRSTLAAMAQTGVLAATAPELSERDRLDALIEIDLDAHFSADPMLRIAAGLKDQGAALAIARRLKLSNEERDRLSAALKPGERIVSFLSPKEVRRLLYRLGAETFQDRVRLAWAQTRKPKTTPQWRALLAMAQSWTRPQLPLTGEEVMAAGVPPGPLVGEVLREVEAWWIDSDFTEDKLSIVERLKAVAQALA